MGSSCQFWERQKEPTQHQALLPPGISQNTCKSKMLMVADFRVWIYALFVRDSHVLMRWPLIKNSSCPICLVALTLSLWRHNPTSCFVSSLNFRFKMLNDENCSHLLYFNCALRWFALRMDVLMNIVTFIVALLVTLSFSSISASSKGLSLSYIIQVTPSGRLGLAWRLWHRVYQAGWT